MKRTLTINLNGIIFNIDEDAYQMLDNYLTEIKRHFSADEEKEILEDIEARIAELLLEKNRTKEAVVTIERITEIIETLGYANQFEEENNEGEQPKNENQEPKKTKKHRKFYRDADNQILGGVAAGLAVYLQINVALVRILFFILAIIGFGWTILAYIIFWVARPEAKSTAQKLEMKGEEPTIDNIRNYLSSEEFNSSAANVASKVGRVLAIVFKIMAVMVGIVMAAFGVTIIFGIISVGIALIVGTLQSPIPSATLLVVFAITFILSLIIPTIAIIITTIRILRNNTKPRNRVAGWSWFSVWVVSVLSSIIMFIFICKGYESLNHRFNYYYFDNFTSINDNNKTTREYLRNSDFNAIVVEGGAKVLLVPDTVNYVEMYASEQAQEMTNIRIDNNTLYINKWHKSPNSKIVVHYKELNGITANGASYIYNRGKLRGSTVKIEANTASKIELDVKCDTINISATTASKVELDGAANYAIISAATASKVEVDDMRIAKARATATAASLIEVEADILERNASLGSFIND
ncbi:MAG: DUF2807 domain-containing protein [bacterium]